jgi:hypothetical protein
MGQKVLGAMWMGKLTVTIKIPTMETLYPCRHAQEEQQPAVHGVRGAAGAAALPPVEVGHNMLQEL